MKIKSEKIKHKHIVHHETKRQVLFKFFGVLILFIAYFIFISYKYGFTNGIHATWLTWSFFVLCTPIADAGLLIDFPLRLILKVRMFILEMFVWVVAIALNLFSLFQSPEIYDKTKILLLFKQILLHPWPFWLIIVISGIGTFVSIQFGDELLDKAKHHERKFYQKHREKTRVVAMIFIFITAIILYDLLLKNLGINLPI